MEQKSKIHLEYVQIKSAEKFRAVAHALDVLEKEMFVRSGLLSFKNIFVCPDIDLVKFYKSDDPMENLLAKMFISFHVKQWGKKSRTVYLEIENKENEIAKRAKKIQRSTK